MPSSKLKAPELECFACFADAIPLQISQALLLQEDAEAAIDGQCVGPFTIESKGPKCYIRKGSKVLEPRKLVRTCDKRSNW